MKIELKQQQREKGENRRYYGRVKVAIFGLIYMSHCAKI